MSDYYGATATHLLPESVHDSLMPSVQSAEDEYIASLGGDNDFENLDVAAALTVLTPFERTVMGLMHGFNESGDSVTMVEVAKELGVNISLVTKTRDLAYAKLRDVFEGGGVSVQAQFDLVA